MTDSIHEKAIRCDAVLRATQALMSRRWCDRDTRDHLMDEAEELRADMKAEGIPFLIPEESP